MKAERYHDISCGHRVMGHASKCAKIHGHNYRVTFYCSSPTLNHLGMVIDFSIMKDTLCEWLEIEWDHRMLMYSKDPLLPILQQADPTIVVLPFNPTAENLARYLVEVIGPKQLKGTGVKLISCRVEETRKCAAIYP